MSFLVLVGHRAIHKPWTLAKSQNAPIVLALVMQPFLELGDEGQTHLNYQDTEQRRHNFQRGKKKIKVIYRKGKAGKMAILYVLLLHSGCILFIAQIWVTHTFI